MKKLSIVLFLFVVVLLTACTGKPDQFTITFDSMGGSEVESIVVDANTVLSELPSDPTREGYRFNVWYENSELFPFDFTKPITKNVTLKAHFVETVTLTFAVGDGTAVDSIVLDKGTVLENVPDSLLDGFILEYWYTDNENVEFDFSEAINEDVTLNAKFDLTDESKVLLDIQYFEENMVISDNMLYFPDRGHYYSSYIKYETDSSYISKSGVVLSLLYGEQERTEEITVTFRINTTSLVRTYDVTLSPLGEVFLTNSATYDFTNLSTEYTVADSTLELFFEEGGSVPYVKITDFFTLLQGFIDPELDMTVEKTATDITMSYQYYDADEDQTYDLSLVVDSVENTFTTDDSGFYWAYVYSTETNYGRNISYLSDHPGVYSTDSNNVIYDLDAYGMDIVMVEGEVTVPFYIANQLFVGPSYYNVYYNYDELFGIYLLPDEGSAEYRAIHGSSVEEEAVPVDLLQHTFNMLAFDLDYLYGLKDIMGVTSYYDLLFEMKDDLLTTDSNDLDQAISELLLKKLDEPHTSYGYMSYYSTDEPSTSSLSDYGDRFRTWYLDGLDATNEVIGTNFGYMASGWNAPRKPDYWFLDETTVMITLNGFDTYDLYEGALFDNDTISYILDLDTTDFTLPTVAADYFYFYNSSTLEDNVLELLAKGVDSTYVDTYTQALVADGYTNVVETSTDAYKVNGYYTKDITLADSSVVTIFVLVSYDEEYDLFYVGVAEKLPFLYTANWIVQADVSELVHADSGVYMEETLENVMAEQPGTTDAILDLTWNTGGNVGALYRVLGYITDQPFTVSGMNRTSGSSSTYVVQIDKANPYTSLNWALLTSKVTFSAANSMTKIFQENDLGPTIGIETGGGACSITPILLPNGTAFTMSSNNISAIRTGSGTELDPYVYADVEFGVTPDYVIPIYDLFDEVVLLGILD